MGKFEGKNAFVRTHHALFLGVRLGVEFKFPIRAGLGYYWMYKNPQKQAWHDSLAGTYVVKKHSGFFTGLMVLILLI
jgi:hypothetical protein